MTRRTIARPIAHALLMTTIIAACADAPAADSHGDRAAVATRVNDDHAIRRHLATIRHVAAPYHDVADARAAGWDVRVPECRDNPPVGGMGWHFLNPAHVSDTVVIELPQILIYEPKRNGDMELVGVEYIIPYSIRDRDQPPPTLMGQTFHQNDSDEVWMLHVWPWRSNPDGVFATWHPRVSCRYAQ